MSHGGLVAAHSHDDGISAHHGGHSAASSTVELAEHDAEDDHVTTGHESAAVDRDGDSSSTNPTSMIHNHIVVDASAKPPTLQNARVILSRFELPLQRDTLPPSATVAPGLEPPDA